MTQHTGGNPASTSLRDEPAPRVAREQVGAAGQRVAETASDQGAEVAREARAQARDLLGQARGQVTDQARGAQNQAAESLQSLAGELRDMADGGDRQGMASDLASEAADRLGDLAEWLGRREPGDLIDEVRKLARRRPGAFLLGAAAAGVLAGRLTRGTIDAKRDTSESDADRGYGGYPATPGGVGSPPLSVPATHAVPPPLPPVAPPPGAGMPPSSVPPSGVPPVSGYEQPVGAPLAPDAPTQPNIPIQPEVGGPASVAPPPPADRSVGEYVDDLQRHGDRPSEGTR
jgi:hypothetical protein